ncbi:variant erythrocyte surface antigen-1 family protein [Babesia caballi]|uniref:Variant erythrocyte surface antigen-1 family protein n=1 Tax=Babesia caballi TaxID=5871 RepID=A0AAV4LU59_BABCB|nr:variant erythrocyte surface antigen-1 family protein [Babesia caballi]
MLPPTHHQAGCHLHHTSTSGQTSASLSCLVQGYSTIRLSRPLLDCPSNLKEAIDWILRVTGKDGGGGNGTTDLTKQVTQLLSEVESYGTEIGVDSGKVQKALDNGSGNGLIAKLAEGLQQFIGYDNRGKLTGGGILPANVAKHQVCNAVLNFVIRFLEGLCEIKELDSQNKEGVKTVIGTLRKCVGSGNVPTGFGQLVGKIREKVETNSGFQGGVGQSLKTIFEKLRGIVTTARFENGGDNVEDLQSFLGEVLKDSGTEQSRNFQSLCDELKNLFEESEIKTSLSTDKKLELNSLRGKIDQVTKQANKINPSSFKTSKVAKALAAGVKSAATAFIAEIKDPGKYTSYYDKAEWNSVSGEDERTKCAKIFLGCLPLYYQALTYIYWGCHDKGGGWGSQTLANGSMRSYFDSQGLLPLYVDKSKRGAHIAESALKGFSEFQAAVSSPTFTYASFTAELQKKVTTNGEEISTKGPLSALFHGASCYFRYQQITTANIAVRAPKTIREMLYFLAALQFSSAYEKINEYIEKFLENDLDVADSSQKDPDNKLSADQLKEYLRASCAFSSCVLGMIQGPSASEKSDPWLYELFCNSAFNFKYPSGTALFSMISSYAYALQFQLLFLYSMCANNVTKCGWQDCTYGKEMNKNGSGGTVPSHICTGLKCQSGSCNHYSGQCKHTFHANNNKEPTCGKATPSPLQAFLTDCIHGLCRSHPTNSTSHLSTCSGALCHSPISFQATHLRQNAANGARVYLVLKSICGSVSSPLRQLCEKIGCLTKRTPRSLGDIFGFTWHLKGQLSTTLNNIDGATWFKDLAGHTPFSNNLIQDYGEKLKALVGTGHTGHDGSPMDLSSLRISIQKNHSMCYGTGKTCGPYLSSLTISNGATFGKPAIYASFYLSWMVYLTDDLETGFQELLDEFKYIDCKASGCRKSATGGQKCDKAHSPGTHGTGSDACSCDSVVHCGGVLPVLYRYGFMFSDMGALFGEGNNGTNTKRTCKAFSDQLQSVISGNPLTNLLTTIDDFLYLFRYYFLSNLSGFWTIYIGIILYTFFFLLDTLHLRSHLKLTSSHTVPPLAILTSGNPLPVTKLTYITQ